MTCALVNFRKLHPPPKTACPFCTSCFDGRTRLLLNFHMDNILPDHCGNTCSHSCFQMTLWGGHPSAIKFMRQVGKDSDQYKDSILPPLHIAAFNGVMPLIAERHYDDILVRDHEGWNCLHCAVRGGKLSSIHFILRTVQERGIEVKNLMNRDKFGFTPLHVAIGCGMSSFDTEIIEFLISNFCDIDDMIQRNSNGHTPFMMAVELDKPNIVNVLSEYVGDPTQHSDYAEMDPLSCAIARGYEHVIRVLCKIDWPFDHRDRNGITPLHIACSCAPEYIVEDILKHIDNNKGQSEILSAKDLYGVTPLHLASARGSNALVSHLLSRIDIGGISVFDNDDNTPLHYACKEGYFYVAKTLIEHGADVNAIRGDGVTPLCEVCASQRKSVTLFNYLVKIPNTDVDLSTKGGRYHPLFCAAENGYVEFVTELIHMGSALNIETKPHNLTALHIASINGFTKCVEQLLASGAKVKRDKHGKTPRDRAKQKGHSEIASMMPRESSVRFPRILNTLTSLSLGKKEAEAPQSKTCAVM